MGNTAERVAARVNTIEEPDSDLQHVTVSSPDHPDHSWTLSRAVAGGHGRPSPLHLLCAAVAGDLEMEVRAAADRAQIPLQALTVAVGAELNPESELSGVVVYRFRCDVRIQPGQPDQDGLDGLVDEAERSARLLAAVRGGLDIAVSADARPVEESATSEPEL